MTRLYWIIRRTGCIIKRKDKVGDSLMKGAVIFSRKIAAPKKENNHEKIRLLVIQSNIRR